VYLVILRKENRMRAYCCGALALALACCSGCSVLIQNRYSVFGFDGLQTESPDQARALSLLLLFSVALGSIALGAFGFWLVQRYYRRVPVDRDVVPHSEEQPETVNASGAF
jgi:hypothetical protein